MTRVFARQAKVEESCLYAREADRFVVGTLGQVHINIVLGIIR